MPEIKKPLKPVIDQPKWLYLKAKDHESYKYNDDEDYTEVGNLSESARKVFRVMVS